MINHALPLGSAAVANKSKVLRILCKGCVENNDCLQILSHKISLFALG